MNVKLDDVIEAVNVFKTEIVHVIAYAVSSKLKFKIAN